MNIFEELGPKYLWWKPIGNEPHSEDRLIAQVMDTGDFDDMQRLAREVGDDRLRGVIAQAEPGWFSPRSWTFWHYRLKLTPSNADVPPLKRRSFEA